MRALLLLSVECMCVCLKGKADRSTVCVVYVCVH